MTKVLVDLVSYTGTKGGTDLYIRNLYSSISKIANNFEFFAIASKEAEKLDMQWFPGVIQYSKLSGNNRLTWAFSELISVSLTSFKMKPHLIHCPANFGPIYSKSPVLLTLHDTLYWSRTFLAPKKFLVRGVKFMQQIAIHSSTNIITDSYSSAHEIERVFNIPKARVKTIYLGAHLNDISVPTNTRDDKYILAGGNRFRHKNWENLLCAWALMNPVERPKLKITGGREPDSLIHIVQKLNLEDSVELLNWVSERDLNELYFNASAVIVPSYFEGFSLPILQALKYRIPLLASNIPVHKEIAKDAAFFFEPESPQSIANTVLSYRMDKDLLISKIELGWSLSLDFTWEKCATETLIEFGKLTSSDEVEK